MAVNPVTGAPWCSTNERDGLGDNLPPDYLTSLQPGCFYGWPWFYIGGHEDPHHRDEHPELRAKVIIPDVLLQAHSASLDMICTMAGVPARLHWRRLGGRARLMEPIAPLRLQGDSRDHA